MREPESMHQSDPNALRCCECIDTAYDRIGMLTLFLAIIFASFRGLWMVATAKLSTNHSSAWTFVMLVEWQLVADIGLTAVASVALVAVNATHNHYQHGSIAGEDDDSRSQISAGGLATLSSLPEGNHISYSRKVELSLPTGFYDILQVIPFALLSAASNMFSSATSFIALMTLSPATVHAIIEAGALFTAVIQVFWGGIHPTVLGIISALIGVFAASQAPGSNSSDDYAIPLITAVYSSLSRAQSIVAQRSTVAVVAYGTHACCGRPPLHRRIALHGTEILRATLLNAVASAIVSASVWCGILVAAMVYNYDVPRMEWDIWAMLGALAQIATPVGRLLTDYTGQVWMSLSASIFTVITINVLSVVVLESENTYSMWAAAGLLILASFIRSFDALVSDVHRHNKHEADDVTDPMVQTLSISHSSYSPALVDHINSGIVVTPSAPIDELRRLAESKTE
jgi:hypothetical protein